MNHRLSSTARRVLFALATVLVAASAAVPAHATSNALLANVVVIGVSGLRWSDVQASPELTALVNESHVGSISVKSSTQQTCPIDGWLTISAGARAWGSGADSSCPAMPAVVGGRVQGWQSYVDLQARHHTGATLGLLGSRARYLCGFGPGGAVATANRQGVVGRWWPTFDPSVLTGCRDAVVDGGVLPLREGRSEALANVADMVRQARAADGWVLLVGVSQETVGAHRETLVAMQTPPDDGPRWLTSGSTRRPGLIQLADIPATILRGAPDGTTIDGAEIHFTGDRHTDAAAVIEDRLDTNQRFSLPRPLLGVVGAVLLLAQLGAIAFYRWRKSIASRRLLVGALLTQGGFFASVFLATATTWWRFPEPGIALFALVVGLAVGVCAVSVALLGRSAVFGVALASYLTLVVDGLLGTPMQVGSMFADGPVIGGRFYGFGNSTFAVFAVATLVVCAWVAQYLLPRGRSVAALAVMVVGGLAILVEGVSNWGADFGGVIALTPAVLLLAWITLRGTISSPAFFGLALTGFVAVAAFAILDFLRPADERSHFGAFVARLLDGQVGDVFARKIAMALGFVSGPIGVLMLLAVLALMAACVAPQKVPSATFRAFVEREPLARPALLALALCGLVGMLLNDASVTVPAIMAGFALPLLVAHLVATVSTPEETRAQEKVAP